eukprot:TRINITY_DN114881_c0_g1_i1.p1 TRINITY_DN114881_c0_g1~~TRINITY_DN114881_c0_g1_i1.p1  ORF type:complete len:252 (+),score=12.29 TRINITY_DN114881_c0_g1_i1:254-1009(+)
MVSQHSARGCGKSHGDLHTTGFLPLVEDAVAVIKWECDSLSDRVDISQIGIIGQSEGALLALAVSSGCSDVVKFAVLQGGPGQNLRDIFTWQAESFLKTSPDAQAKMQASCPLIYWIYIQLTDLLSAVDKGDKFFELGDNGKTFSFDLCCDWPREHFANPPKSLCKGVSCPVLILHGELDHNVPKEDPKLVEAFLKENGNDKVEIHVFPGLDHSFRRLGTPDEDFVAAMARPLDPELGVALLPWLKKTSAA